MKLTGSVHARPEATDAGGGCVAIGGWLLTPEGGILQPDERTAVIADVHLGYEWARGAAGDSIPEHSFVEVIERLERLLSRLPVDRLVIAGDLVESARPCRRTLADVGRLRSWLEDRHVRFVLVPGNHDRGLHGLLRGDKPAASDGVVIERSLEVGGWTIIHGHSHPKGSAGRLVLGHHHPVLKVTGRTFPCFVAGPRRIILPAFSRNAAGLDVASLRESKSWFTPSLRCLTSTGDELLDFGPIRSIAALLRANGVAPK